MDIAEVAAMFNFTNRLASGLGWVPNDEFVDARARRDRLTRSHSSARTLSTARL